MLPRFQKYNVKYTEGAIIGEAELVDCILVDENFQNKLRKIDEKLAAATKVPDARAAARHNIDKIDERSNHTEKYAWKLENVKKYDKPIYMKGKLGLWNIE